jgi:hypothetical protein
MNYPKNSDTKHLYQKTNIMMEEYSANNVLFHWIVMWVDMIIDMSRLRVALKIKKIREAITHKYLNSKISNKSIIPYRKYLIIHKK